MIETKIRYYTLHGKEVIPAIGVLDWARKFDSNRVAWTRTGDTIVSTVFLGVDHQWIRGKPPHIFETMIFGGQHEGYQERYATWDQAEAGHARAVELVESEPYEDECA